MYCAAYLAICQRVPDYVRDLFVSVTICDLPTPVGLETGVASVWLVARTASAGGLADG